MSQRASFPTLVMVCLLLVIIFLSVTTTFVDSSQPTAAVSLPQQTMGTCRCTDLNDLFNRKGELEAAIATLLREEEIVVGMQVGSKPVAYNDSTDSHLLRDDIQKVIDELHDPAIKDRVKNSTFSPDCESSMQGPPCLNTAAKVGEAVYHEFCENRQTSLGVSGEIVAVATGKNWQEQTPLFKMLEIARDSYNAELKFIDDEIERLKPLCKTKGWTGKIIVSYKDDVHTTFKSGGPTPITTNTQNVDRRDITIFLFDGKAFGEVSSRDTHTSVTKGEGDAECGKYTHVPVKVDKTETIDKHAEFFHRASASANIDTRGVVTINLSINGDEGVGTSSVQDNGSGGCRESPHDSWTKFLPKESMAGVTLTALGQASPNALVLDGVDLPKTMQMILGSTRTRIVKVEWHLTRSK